MDPQLDLVLRLVAAGVLGTVVGLERESRGRDPGSRTHALVAVGAALFTVAGAYGFSDLPRSTNVDPARLAAQVATGIGFIGAGAIIRSGFSVRGLTTAATLWMSAALGVAAGAGAYVAALAATGVGFVVLVGLGRAKPLIRDLLGPRPAVLQLEYERGHGTLGPVLRELEREGCRLGTLRLDDADDPLCAAPGMRRATIEIHTRDRRRLGELVASFQERSEVRGARLEPV
jgi:putative Mg2+ transporter-C (MgtC) family protein